MSMELEAVRNQLQEAENKSSRPSPLLLQLQREMAELKVKYYKPNMKHLHSKIIITCIGWLISVQELLCNYC